VIKAVFFDWSDTLAHPEPNRQEVVRRAAQELGVELPLQGLKRGIYEAESQAPSGAPPRWREGKDEAPFIHWWEILLAEIGVKLSKEVMLQITRRLKQLSRSLTWALYDDALPTLRTLKQQGLVLGLITAMGKDVNLVCKKLGIEPYLDFVATSEEAGANKPEPPIFLLALERARVDAREAVYVGDQYRTDVLGARGVGIRPVLIDRSGLMPGVSDCTRIRSLTELDRCLQ